jgi:hypothetical protein
MSQSFRGQILVLALGLTLPVAASFAGDAAKELQPRGVKLTGPAIPLNDALTELRKQTGNTVADRRITKNQPKLTLALNSLNFWPALEEIARQADARISPYQQDGTVALVDGPYRPTSVSYHGLFRAAVRRRTLTRDEDTGDHSCVVHVELAWEPRFQPFYVGVGPSEAGFSRDDEGKALRVKIPGRGQLGVAGRSAVDLEFRMPAPKRSAARIEQLKGTLQIIGPSKMLTFTFPALKPIKQAAGALRQEQEGIQVSLTRITVQPERWSFDVSIQNPPGGPQFESYQSWLDNNRIYLEKGQGRERQVFFPQPADEEQLENVTATRAGLRYHFTNRSRTQAPPGKLEDWRLVYRTPGRIVELTVPFAFKDLRLP